MTTEQENTYEKVVDIKSKKPFKQSNKLCDEHQADWVAEEVCKVINKAMKKKLNAFNIAVGLAEVTISYVHDTAPDTLSAQHLLNSTIGLELDRKVKEKFEGKDDYLEKEEDDD